MKKKAALAWKACEGTKSVDEKDIDYSKFLPKNGKPGKWLPEGEYTVTMSPYRWKGNRIFLCEYPADEIVDQDYFFDDLKVPTFRFVKEITIENCIDIRFLVRILPNLRGIDLSGANLSEVYLVKADLRGANLRYARLYQARLAAADLRGADLENADLYGADLRYARLDGANLKGAELHYADLRFAFLRGADCTEAFLNEINAYGADLFSANLTEARTNGMYFSE